MALKMLLVKPVPEPVVQPQKVWVEPTLQTEAQTDVQALTAEYIELWQKFEYFEVKALIKRMEDIRKQLVSVANETLKDTQPAVFVSAAGEVEFSERGTKATVDNPLALLNILLNKFGPEVTTTVVDVAITPLRKILSEHELKAHLTDEPGVRTLRAVRPVK